MSIIAIIEDDANKRHQIKEVTAEVMAGFDIVEARSFSSGRALLMDHNPAIALLDMSIPMFDITNKDKGFKPLGFGGRDIMEEIIRYNLSTKVIVVTQFDVFGVGQERKTLEELKKELAESFKDFYRGTVYYHPSSHGWKQNLNTLLSQLLKEIGSQC